MNEDILSSYIFRLLEECMRKIIKDESNANYIINVNIMIVKQLERPMIFNCF